MDNSNKQGKNKIIQSRFKELLARKMRLENRNITYEIIADETGISKSSIQKWATNTLARRDDHATMAFLEYFDCTFNELLVVVKIGSEDDDPEGQIKETLAA